MIFYGTSLDGDLSKALEEAVGEARRQFGTGLTWSLLEVQGHDGLTDIGGHPVPSELTVRIEARAVFSATTNDAECYADKQAIPGDAGGPVAYEPASLAQVLVESLGEQSPEGFPNPPVKPASDPYYAYWEGFTVRATNGTPLAEIHQWHLTITPLGYFILNGQYGLHYNPSPDDFMKVVLFNRVGGILWEYVPDLPNAPCRQWIRLQRRSPPRFPDYYFDQIDHAELHIMRSTWSRC